MYLKTTPTSSLKKITVYNNVNWVIFFKLNVKYLIFTILMSRKCRVWRWTYSLHNKYAVPKETTYVASVTLLTVTSGVSSKVKEEEKKNDKQNSPGEHMFSGHVDLVRVRSIITQLSVYCRRPGDGRTVMHWCMFWSPAHLKDGDGRDYSCNTGCFLVG